MDKNRTTYKLFSIVLAAVILFSVVQFVTSAQDDKIAPMLRRYMAETLGGSTHGCYIREQRNLPERSNHH